MVSSRKDMQRRRHKRFLMGDEAFVTTSSMRVGSIRNISRGGMLIRCIKERGSVPSISEVNIYTNEKSCCFLRGVQCSLIHQYTDEIMGDLEVRYCGIQFRDLSRQQVNRLNLILNTCTVGKA